MERLFLYLTDPNLSGNVAYSFVFGILVLCGLGLPLPEDIPLIASGYLVWDKTFAWVPAIIITMGGVLIGDTVLYFIGRKLGLALLDKPSVQSFLKPEKVLRARGYFEKYGDKIVFFARFVAGFRAAAFFLAGAMGMPFRRFIGLDALAAALSVPLWILLGYGLGHYFGTEINKILASIHQFKTIITVVIFGILIAVTGRYLIKYLRARRTA